MPATIAPCCAATGKPWPNPAQAITSPRMSEPTSGEIIATQIASAWLAGVKPKRRDVFTADLREHIAALEAGLKPGATEDCPQVAALTVLKTFLALMESRRAS